MKSITRTLCLLLSAVLLLSMAGCGVSVDQVMNVIAPEETPIPGSDREFFPDDTPTVEPLELSYTDMDNVYSPFWAEKDGDKAFVRLTQLALLALEGSRSPSDISRSSNGDGSVTVRIRLRDDLVCSDGTRLTADDLLFTYYVLLDMDYDGPYELKSLPIRGLSSYWNGMDDDLLAKYMMKYHSVYLDGAYDTSLQEALRAAQNEARNNNVSEENLPNDQGVRAAQAELDAYDTASAELIRSTLERYWQEDAQSIVDYTTANYNSSISLRTPFTTDELLESPGIQVMYAMLERSLGSLNYEQKSFTSNSGTTWDLVTQYPTAYDLYSEMKKTYGDDVEQYWLIEGYGRSSILDKAMNEIVYNWASQDSDWRGDITSIEGIVKSDEYTLSVTLDYCDETVLKTLCDVYVAPLSVYGSTALFAPDKGSFGFTKGDLSAVRARLTECVGAGPYVYDKTDIRTLYFNANENYWQEELEYPTAILSHKS